MKAHIVALMMLTAVFGGCAVVQEKTLGESFDDASSSGQIKSRLLTASPSKFSEVDVEVTGRLALLTGRVTSPEDKIEAERIAWTVRTIDEIANEIEIIDKSSILKNVNDEWITGQVRMRLFGDSKVKSVNYNIETFNGVVYLLGLAMTEDELKRAAEHASTVRGVQRVVSYVKMRDRSQPTFLESPQPEARPDEQGAPLGDTYGEPFAGAPYTDPYADPYGNDASQQADDDYSDLVGGTN